MYLETSELLYNDLLNSLKLYLSFYKMRDISQKRCNISIIKQKTHNVAINLFKFQKYR